MKWRPFKSYLAKPLNLPTGKAWYEEDILNAERAFVKQFESSSSAEVKEQQEVDVDKAGVIALKILENVNPKLTDQEQAIFIAGFQECIKWINNQ